jgi:hypothetical protein
VAATGGGQVTITQRLMKPGGFTLQLKPGAPKSVMQQIDLFDHVVITRTRLLPVDAYSDADVLGQSQFTGVIESLSRTANSLSGFDLSYWLGTPDGRGDLLDSAVSRTSGTLSNWVGDLRPSSLSAGTVTNTSTLTASYQWMTRREALDAVCQSVSAEWRVNPDFTLDAGPSSSLFVTTPTSVITRRPQGTDGPYRGYDVVGLDLDESASTYVTKVFVVADAASVGSATGSTSYKDGLNNSVVLEEFVSSPREDNPTTVATAVVAERNALRKELRLSSSTYNVSRFVSPGDWVYVWDERAGLVDQAVQITYNGSLISPVALRVYSVTYPIEQGVGVYVRQSGSTASYVDVTDWVEWESSPVLWEVGAAPVPLSDLPKGRAYLGENPSVLASVAASGTYTPTPFGFVVGTGGTNTATYDEANGWIDIEGTITFGTSGQTFPGASCTVTLPTGYQFASTTARRAHGLVTSYDATSGETYTGVVHRESSTTMRFLLWGDDAGTGSGFVTNVATSTTNPFTWAANDQIIWGCRAKVVRV